MIVKIKFRLASIHCLKRYDWHSNLPLFQETAIIEGTPVNLLIVGDPAYPLLPWLMKAYPYHGSGTSAANMAKRDSFNVYMNSGRMLIEGAFGRLKGRWRRLLKRNEIDHRQLRLLISTCCILHNFCESQGEQFYDVWMPDAKCSRLYPQPSLMPHRGPADTSANQMRDAICAHLARHHPLRRSQMRPWLIRMSTGWVWDDQ